MNPAAKKLKKADHVIVINYEGNRLGPQPPKEKVKVGKSIRFDEGSMPAGHTMHITFEHPEHFSAKTFREGDDPIVVRSAFPEGHGSYVCKLVKAGQIKASDIPGGSLELDL
jgi:hypothetical protein